MKRKLWLFLFTSIMATTTFATLVTPINHEAIQFRFRNPDQIEVNVKDIPGEGYISIYNDSRATTGRASDDLTVTCDNEPPFIVQENQTFYCFNATNKVTVALKPENFKFGSSGLLRRRLVG